jgi:glycerol-3-phosphate acyltransferase PlsY
MQTVLTALLGYIIGSIPFAFLLSRRRGIDLRAVGSGNVGATNVLRTSGVPAAVAAMCLDAAKGYLAVLVARRVSPLPAAVVAAACASILGHVYPIWLGFRGGKGVATAAGAFALLAPIALTIAAGAFVVAAAISRYISVGSLAGAIALAAAALVTSTPAAVRIGAVAAALLILFRHRGNIARLLSGTERRVGVRL